LSYLGMTRRFENLSTLKGGYWRANQVRSLAASGLESTRERHLSIFFRMA